MAAAAAGGDDDAGFEVLLSVAIRASAFQEREYEEAARRSEEALVCSWMHWGRRRRSTAASPVSVALVASSLQIERMLGAVSTPSLPKEQAEAMAKLRREREEAEKAGSGMHFGEVRIAAAAEALPADAAITTVVVVRWTKSAGRGAW